MSLCECAWEDVCDVEVLVSVNRLCGDFRWSVDLHLCVVSGFWPLLVPAVQNLMSAKGASGSLDHSQFFLLWTLTCCLPQSPLLTVGL